VVVSSPSYSGIGYIYSPGDTSFFLVGDGLGVSGGYFHLSFQINGGTQWCSWLRHCATSQKVVGSIPDGVIEIFH
jgi:hypothetical protein